MLGALLAGRPYVPLDPALPAEHLRRTIVHSGAQAIICGSLEGIIPPDAVPKSVARLKLDEAPAEDHRTAVHAGPETVAYVIYTSGSTGAPKGVWQDQRGLVHDVLQYSKAISITPADRLSLLYSPSVNGALRDIFGALLNGATLCMSDLRREGFAKVLGDLAQRRVTVLHAMPPVLRSLARASGRAIAPDARVLYTAGDRLLDQDLLQLRESLPFDCQIYTGIGSTECATLYRQWTIPRDWMPDGTTIPVGHAIDDREMRLIDDAGAEVAHGMIGHVEVSSPFLAKGYWNDPDRSSASFKSCPGRPGWRRFRPGDLGRIRPDGLMEFIGRSDGQIKVRGYRLDPIEIEAALRRIKDVAEAVVTVYEAEARARVVPFVEAPDIAMTEVFLLGELARQLQPHLVPERIFVLDKIPRLPNFKFDVARLRVIATECCNIEPGETLPQAYLSIWESILKRPVGPDVPLTRLGADSLTLLEIELLVARQFGKSLRGHFRPNMTPRQLWQVAPKIAEPEIAENAKKREIRFKLGGLMANASGVPIGPDGILRGYNLNGNRLPLIWCFNLHQEADALAAALGSDQPLIAFRSLNGILPPYPPDAEAERFVAENCLLELEKWGLPPSIVVGGNCQAARIALHLANSLWLSGCAVASLVFMEKVLPIPYAGRHMVLFGAESHSHNPIFRFSQPQAAWSRYLPNVRSREIPGAHGQFFAPQNINQLAGELRREIDAATAEPAPLLSRLARRVRLAVSMGSPAEGAAACINVMITNPGPFVWPSGTVSGLALTIHILQPSEIGRPHRVPDFSLPLPISIGPGQTCTIQLNLPEGMTNERRLMPGLCEEGFEWFDEII
jgi:acyl-coenzyme A synthetase/AMP-(fatty) acid ligase